MIIVSTDRLNIQKITQNDAVNLSQVLKDPEIMKYSTVGVHNDKQIDEYIRNCAKQYEDAGYGHWAIYSTFDQSFIGVCGLHTHVIDKTNLLHISYRLPQTQQGKGYASEAVNAVLSFVKKSLNTKVVSALIDSENLSSVKVAKRVGFKYQKASELNGFKVDVYQINI